ncbi:allophanate hydrolase subunit 1 [Streptomyces sp. RB6PN25]|uniref:Allophanate hydrolase subunit 1 n=1 Tax=Streptomyces humicola TaxID=2953240 RepID=A0ABT1Q0U7_9ACTN|nr:allophanate hydrolase subunit 1 [Streptomyces humicola]MCQ4083565.1 allophanate hydrolase subunit 1 [Streptomyces humicola]
MRAVPVGRRALLVEVETSEEVAALHGELLRRRAVGALPGVDDIVPAARTVLVDGLDDPQALAAELPHWTIPRPRAEDGPERVIRMRFDGPDLDEVAQVWGIAPGELPGLFEEIVFRVAFCGFAPGFGYLTGLPGHLRLPRRATPRTCVPAGSVALAGPYAGVYPRSSPGGWQLIGSTDAVLWDPSREPAALLAPGARVRFRRAAR